MTIERTALNPWPWSQQLGYDQATVVTGATRTLYCAGQTATDATGAPQHEGDMAAQLTLCLDNLDAVLDAAGMGLGDVVRLGISTTDVDLLFRHYGVLGARLGAAGATPPTTLLGVARLAMPSLLVEVEATAVA